jgi:hypothetical protein
LEKATASAILVLTLRVPAVAASMSQAAAPGPSIKNAASSALVAFGVRSPSLFSRGG